ncbi:MAG: RNA polymerase sigma-70 factor [Bacteroidales bacterium]|nr:RNA polymerase sigma-70 factor [Bacteroidales bacterium]
MSGGKKPLIFYSLNNSTEILSPQAYEALFNQYYKMLVSFARSFVFDEDAAQEVVQNVFINLWHKRDAVSHDTSLKSYLYTSVRNRSLNYLRDNGKYRSEFLDEEITQAFEDQVLPMELNDLQSDIDKAMDLLPDKCREVFELSRFEGKKYQEIAEVLGISIKTVENQISKALKILREALKNHLSLLIFLTLGVGGYL